MLGSSSSLDCLGRYPYGVASDFFYGKRGREKKGKEKEEREEAREEGGNIFCSNLINSIITCLLYFTDHMNESQHICESDVHKYLRI